MGLSRLWGLGLFSVEEALLCRLVVLHHSDPKLAGAWQEMVESIDGILVDRFRF